MMNPLHDPATAAAIWNAAMNGGVTKATRESLLALIEGATPAPVKGAEVRRSIEIVLSRVRMHEAMRRDLMSSLAAARARG